MEELSPFLKEYYRLKSEIAPFELRRDFETVKTVSVVNVLLERAYNVNAGASTHGRFGFGPGHNVENYMCRARAYTEALLRGEYPLKGRFTEPGTALVDHSFVERDGVMHLFYNRGYIGYEWDTMPVNTVGHATTEDLINWKVEPPVVSVDEHTFEDYQVWSPGVAFRDGVYYMYYTGVNENVAQAICLATSGDLYNWKKYENKHLHTKCNLIKLIKCHNQSKIENNTCLLELISLNLIKLHYYTVNLHYNIHLLRLFITTISKNYQKR